VALGIQLSDALGSRQALAILGDQATISAAGTNQATATAITTAVAIVSTVALGTGVILPKSTAVSLNGGDRIHIANHGANALAVYPPVGGKLSNNTVNVPAMIAPNKCADFYNIDGTNWTALLSA